MPKVIVVSNNKGGIGKTTTAMAISTILNRMGHKALLVDTDSQGNASDTFQAKIDQTATLYDVLLEAERISIQEAIQHTPSGDIVAGDALLQRADSILKDDIAGAFRLKSALAGLPDDYEYVIVDTAPNLGELTKNALIAADEVIIPVSADRYAIQGLSNIIQAVAAIKQTGMNPDVKVTGIVLTAYPERTTLGQATKEDLEEIAKQIGTKVLYPPIRRTIKVQKAHAERMPIVDYDPECTAAQDYVALVKRILEG